MREQNAALGVSLADLVLPDTLEAYAAEPNFGDAEEPPPAESKPEDSEDGVVDSGTPPESSSAPDSTPPESEKPESTPPQSSSFEANSTPPESSSSEVNSTPPEGEKPESTPPESSSSEANSTPPESSSSSESAPAEPPSESSEPAASEPESVPAEPAASGEAPNADEPAAAEEAPSADEPATRVLAAYVQGNIAQADGEATTHTAVTVEGITWTSTPEFDGDTAGTYIFTAVLPSGYAIAKGADMPEITVTVGHILEYGDCMDFTCPTHYTPEVLALMNEDETPLPLTLEDLIEDYGIEAPAPRRTRAAASPQTLVVTDDNENNAHTGTADGDIDAYIETFDENHPIEIAFSIPADKMPTQSAYLAVKAMDVDEDDPTVNPEHDYVYINDDIFLPQDTFEPGGSRNCYNPATIGYLSGTNMTWNTTVLEIPPEKLKPGKNVISITVAPKIWVVKVDWMQLILDGGERDANIDSFSLKLGDPVNTSDSVQVPATVTIQQKGRVPYATEYSLIQTSTGNMLDTVFGWAQTQETVALSMPKNSQTGTYKIIGILKDLTTEAIKASDEVSFQFTQNVGAVLAPKMTHTLTPSGLTNQSVTIAASVADSQGCTDISIQDNGQRTVAANGKNDFIISYKYYNTSQTITYTVPVNNIDKTPPVIAYTAFSVLEGTSDAEVAPLFKAALTATDDRQVAGAPTYTLPANIAATLGAKSVTVTATDAAGNTATQSCVITVTPLPLKLAQNEPARVGVTNSFTLSAVLKSIGGDAITETGFVWGIMQSPTTAVNNGKAATTPAVTAKGGTITVTAADIADGVTYYARPYAISGGVTFYGDQKPFFYTSKQYGTFAITGVSSNNFTITRTGGSEDAQTVYYRTVNGSAVGGTHFTHAAGTVTFAAGETSKIVTVTELGVNAVYGGKPATAYTNASRTYQLEIYRVEGGGTIPDGVSRARRIMYNTTEYSVDRSHYNYQVGVTATSIGDNRSGTQEREVREDFYGIPKANGDVTYTYKGTRSIPNLTLTPLNSGLYPNKEMAYIRDTASAMRVQLQDLNCIDDTTYMVYKWVLFNTTSANPQMVADKKDKFDNQKGQLPATTKYILIYGTEPTGGNTDDVTIVTLPKPKGTQLYPSTRTSGRWHIVREEWYRGDQPSREYVQYGFDETCYISLGSYGGSVGNQYMSFNSGKLAAAPEDSVEPQFLGVAPMAGGTYKPGDSVTVSLVFDEIVDFINSYLQDVSLNTNYGTMNYAGGDNTNVLYFTGTVPEGASGTITVSSINNAAHIRDMCDQTGTSSGGGSGNITVDTVEPGVVINDGGIANGTAKGTIIASNHSSLKYTWSQSTNPPVSGWLSCTSGFVAQTRQTTGVWYLYAIAERSSNGTSNFARASFDFNTTASPLPALAVSADNTSWAHSRNITVARTPANAAVTYAGPQSGTASGNTVTVTANGLYTFTLTSGGETITEMVSVSRLDAVAPTLTLREPGGTEAVYNTLTFAADAADNLSGIAKVEYAITGTSAVPGSGWAALSGSGGSYNGSYTETSASKTTKYIHVRATDVAGNVTTKTSAAYTTVKENAAAAPVITLTGAPASWTKGPVNLTWNVTNQGAGGITVILNGSTSTATSGTLAAAGNGLYSVSVTDQNGVSANAGLLVDKIDAEAPILTGISSPTGWAASKTVTVTGVTDNRTPLPDASGTTIGYGGSGLKTQEWKLGGGAYTAFSGSSFAVTATGTYTVRLTDNAGNQNEYETLVSQVDATVPVVTVGTPAAGWTSAAQSIPVTYTDSESGIATAQYAIVDNTATKPASGLSTLPASGQSVSVAANGTNYIYYKVTDKAGNVKDGYSGAIKVDTTAPTLTVTGGDMGAVSLNLAVTSSFGASGGTVAVSGAGSGAVGNSYIVNTKGIYNFTATSNAGKTATAGKTVHGITFDSKGGSAVASQLVVSGGKATAPTNPTKTGLTFAKWQKGGADFNPASDTITADTALTAVWTLNAPTVSLAIDKTEATYNGGNTVATLTASPSHPVAGATYAYEWYKGSTKVSGATGKTLELKTVADGGSYIVKVTASDGTLTSPQAESGAVSVKINRADTEITTQPTGSGITYGQSLSNSTLIGGAASQKESSFFGRIMKPFITSVPVPGVFSWTDGSITPAVSDSIKTEYSVTFTPTDTANYNTSTTTQKLAVGRKQLTPSVNTVSDKTYDGNTDAVGTIRLDGAVLRESPAASGTFAFTDKNAGRGKNVNVTGITLDGTWGANYALDKAELTNVSTTAEIIPKTIGLSWSGHTDLVYTGTPVDITAAATGLIEPDICAVTVTDGKKTDAGAYTATAAALDNGNYKLPSSATQSYTIAKAPVTFVVTNNVYDYESGTSRAATVAQTAGETPSIAGSFKVSYEKDGNDIENPTDVDVYDVLAELTDQNFKHEGETDSTRKIKVGTLTIKGIAYPPFEDGTMTWPTSSELTYGQTLGDSTLTGGNQADKGTYAWKTPTDIPTVSTQKAIVKFTPTDTNYSPAEKEIDISVIKATPTLTMPTAEGIIYGDTLTKSAITGGSAKATYNGADTDVPGTYTWTTPATMPAVADGNSTEYDLTFTPTDTDNYKVVGTGKIKLAVDKRAVGLQWHGDTGLVYTGNAVNVTATATELVGSDACEVTVTGGTETDAGAYTATAAALDNGNYKLPGTGLTEDYTIAKAPVTFAVTNNVYDYESGTSRAAKVTQTADETPSVVGSFKVSYKKDGNDIANPTDVDVYDVLAELTDQNFKHNNKADSETKIWVGLLTINGIEYPNADTMTWPEAGALTYGQPLSDSALIGGDQAANGGYAWKDDAIIPTVTNGGYTVVFTPADTNYAPVEHTVSITVAKATAALTLPTAAGITYGDTLAKSTLNGGSASATYNGADKAVPGKYTWTAPATIPKVSDSNSTEYGLTFTPTDTANYNVVTSGRVKLAVAQKPVGLTWAGHAALVYSGAPVTVTATATGLVGSDVCTVTVTDGTKTDAGTHTATAAAVSNANYKLPDNAEQAYTIAKKPIKVLWSNMFPTYDGTAKTPTVVLDGVVGGEDCTVISTDSAAAGNAGRYKVAAALLGARSGNYTMQNPNEILVIQSAPVSVSLSDYSYKYDGAAKYATVTASPDVPTTVTYKLAGNAVAAPTEEGIYDIIVELNGRNYRFADGSDGKARRMGALTIYKEKPPELYTITFDKGAEDAAGTAPALPPSVRDTVHFLPNNSFLRAGHAFVGWKNGDTLYQPGERFSQPANNNTVFTAQWEAATYDIGGVVDQDGKPVANVRVVLMRGAEQVAETVTNQIGEYRFDSVLPGLYNLVASKPSPDGVGDIIMTIMVEVKTADVEQANITLPSGKTNSIVEVAPGTPKIIVGNLDQTFKNTEGSDYTPEDKEVVNKGGTVEIKFSAKEKQKDEIATDAEEITKEAGRAKIGLYLALDVEKTVTQPTNPDAPDAEPSSDTTVIPETSVLLESVIPLPSDLQGKESYTVYRVHEGAVDSLTTGADSGERIEVSEDKTMLVLYAQKYSTYAIAYTEKSGGGNGSGGSNNGDDNSGAFTPTGPEVVIPPVEAETSKPEAPRPEASQPDNPKADGTDKDNGGDSDKNNGTNNENGENERADGGSNDAQKDEIRDALEDAIKNLPDTLTDEQRQEYIDRLTAIADAAIAALDGTNEPGEWGRIVTQAKTDMEKPVAEAWASVGGTAKPFVVLSAIFALAAVLLAVFALLKRKNKRRGLFSAIFAAFAVIAFLLTSGWSGFALANWWTVVVAAFAIGAALGVFVGYSKDEQPQTK